MEKKATCKTAVFWDIDSCPVPPCYDATLVGPSIHLALEKLGYGGPLTITAVGRLRHTSQHVLRAISSTGIVVKYGPCGTLSQLHQWRLSNPAPATIMLICGSSVLENLSVYLHSLQMEGYNILVAYPSALPENDSELVASAEWLWSTLLTDNSLEVRRQTGEPVASAECIWRILVTDGVYSDNNLDAKRQFLQQKCSETDQSDSFSCTLCGSAWETVEEFTTHLVGLDHEVSSFEVGVDTSYLPLDMLKKQSKRLKKRTFKSEIAEAYRRKNLTTLRAKKATCNTAVFWDIDSCPVPPCYDPTLVGPSIHLALEKLGCSGPLTITAVGKLKRTSQHVLRAISSTGIDVTYGSCGQSSTFEELEQWERNNPPPATIMLISDSSVSESFSRCLHDLQMKGYKILLAHSSALPENDSELVPSAESLWSSSQTDNKLEARIQTGKLVASAVCLWRILLTDAMYSDNKLGAKRQFLERKCRETVDCDSFSCELCEYAWGTFEKFSKHLKGLDHQVKCVELGADTSYLESVTLGMLEKKLKRLKKRKFKNERDGSTLIKEVTTSIEMKNEWEKLKEKLKRRKKENKRISISLRRRISIS